MRAKRREESKGAKNEWMNTYADMVTLLLCFFILLFSFSSIDAIKWKQIVSSLSGNLSVLDSGEEIIKQQEQEYISELDKIKIEQTIESHRETKVDMLEELYKNIVDYIERENIQAEVEVSKSENEILIRFLEKILFDSGSAKIKEVPLEMLSNISNILLEYEKDLVMIRIEGHTDDVPINTALYPTNWELSTARAVEVLRFLAEVKQFNPKKLSAVGYGEFHPINKNSTIEEKSRNRRVDVVVSRVFSAKQ